MTVGVVRIVRRTVGPNAAPNTAYATPARVEPGAWWESALCRTWDADLFCVPDGVSPRRKRDQESKAKQICRACPVRKRCLDEAMARDEQHGVWGGLDTGERRQLERRRRGSLPSPSG